MKPLHLLLILILSLYTGAVVQAKKSKALTKAALQKLAKSKKVKTPPTIPPQLQKTMKKLPAVTGYEWSQMVNSIRKVRAEVFVMPSKYKKTVKDGVEWLARDASFVPFFEKGRVHGFKFLRLRKKGVFQRLEFQSGDILLHINGFRFLSPRHVMKAYGTLLKSCKWKFLLRRKGKEIQRFVSACS